MAKAIVIYETTYGYTETMAKAIVAGLKGKLGAAFGAYGFSGEFIEMICDTMKHIFEMDVIEPAFKLKSTEVVTIGDKEGKEFGMKIAAKIT